MHPTNLPCWTAMASGAPVPNQFLRRSGYSKKPTKERSIFELEKLNKSLLTKLDKKPTFNGRKCFKNDWVIQLLLLSLTINVGLNIAILIPINSNYRPRMK